MTINIDLTDSEGGPLYTIDGKKIVRFHTAIPSNKIKNPDLIATYPKAYAFFTTPESGTWQPAYCVADCPAINMDLVKNKTDPPDILAEASKIIRGQRQQDYGDKLINFTQIANLWEATLATKLGKNCHITPEDVALCMIQVKLARLAKSPSHRDSLLDIAGYAGCYEILQAERTKGTELPPAFKDFGLKE